MRAITVRDRKAGVGGLTVGQRAFGLTDWTATAARPARRSFRSRTGKERSAPD